MKKLGIFVGENNWTFFKDIYQYLSLQYSTSIFEPKTYKFPLFNNRLNRWMFRKNFENFLKEKDVCFFEWASDLLMHASRLPKHCAIITRLHSFELFDWAPKINWESVDKIIVVSRAMQIKFCDLYPDHAKKTVVIYNGVSLNQFIPSHNRDFQYRIGMLCNIVPIKRVYEIILSVYELIHLGYKLTLIIAGKLTDDQRYTAAMVRLVRELNLQDNIIFDGYVIDTPSWLNNIDVFVSNSYWEGQQVSLIEAMASGCYCLSHRWSGVEELLPDENLYYTENEFLEKIIEYFLLSADEKIKKKNMMRSIINGGFSIEKTEEEIFNVVENVIQITKQKNPRW